MARPAALRCDYCPYGCSILPGKTGRCGVRMNVGRRLITRFRDRPLEPRLDPIEKKPLYHYYPGSPAFSVSQAGCNMRCGFCQNWHLVDVPTPEQDDVGNTDSRGIWTPESLAQYDANCLRSQDRTIELWRRADRPTMAFTYSEPGVWQDHLIELSIQVRNEGGRCAIISNGFYSDETLARLLDAAEAFNIDVKGSDHFYKTHCGGALEPILRAVKRIASSASHVLEVTTLAIEGLHSSREIIDLARRLSDLGVQVWHLSLFHPAHHMAHRKATSSEFALDILEQVDDIKLFPYMYLGNFDNERWSTTRCPSCGAELISRHGYETELLALKSASCASCGQQIYGRFEG